jgi:ATP-dependent Clp protease protease subunit
MSLPPELQSALLERRLIFLRGRLDDALSNSVIAQLVLANSLAKDKAIELFIDSAGGTVNAALALYDVMRTLGTPVSTTCSGTAGGASVLILASGTPARRFALPHARIHLSDDHVDMAPARGDNLPAYTEEARRATARWRAALLQSTNQDPERLASDLAASRWLSASEAIEYGLTDAIGTSR